MPNELLSDLGSYASIIGLPIALGTTAWQWREKVAAGRDARTFRLRTLTRACELIGRLAPDLRSRVQAGDMPSAFLLSGYLSPAVEQVLAASQGLALDGFAPAMYRTYMKNVDFEMNMFAAGLPCNRSVIAINTQHLSTATTRLAATVLHQDW